MSHRSTDTAAGALLLGTVFWGCGFTWAKVGGQTLNSALDRGEGAAVGPILLLAVRFLIAGVLWALMFPAARRGWTVRSVCRALLIGTLLTAGLVFQHLGLDLTSAAVSAFLTSLSIVFVPIASTVVLRRAPGRIVWLAVVVATAGVWCMTGATPQGFGLGELLGLACAIVFTVYMLVVNALIPRDNPFRMTAGQFIVTGALSTLLLPVISGGAEIMTDPVRLVHVLSMRDIWLNGLLLVVFPTLGAYGLLTHFQPRLDATRAAVIYLFEPVFAALYAFVFAGAMPSGMVLVGAGLILLANVIVELLGSRALPDVQHAPHEQV